MAAQHRTARFGQIMMLLLLLLPAGCITESGDPVDEVQHAVQRQHAINFLADYNRAQAREDAEKRKAEEVLRDATRRQRRAGIDYNQRTANTKILRKVEQEERNRAIAALETPGGESGGGGGH